MTDDEVRAAGADAVRDWPPLPDDLVIHVGALLRDDTTPETRKEDNRDRAA